MIRLKFEPRDIWVGLYWDMAHVGCTCPGFDSQHPCGSGPHWHRKLSLYFCLLPMLPIKVTLRFPGVVD